MRRNEILDIAQELFITKGYDKTTIENVIKIAKIAKGTFYYYFKSKEELVDAIINRFMDESIKLIQSVIDNPNLSAVQKLYKITTFKYNKDSRERKEIEKIQQIDNAQLFQKTLVEAILRFTPNLSKIVEQGVKEGTFKTEHPYEAAELMMLISQFLFENHLIPWKKSEITRKTDAYTCFLEDLLGAERGSLHYMKKAQKKRLNKPPLFS